MKKWLRDVEISPPTFDSLAEALEYRQRFQQPQRFIDDFVRGLQGRIKWSAERRYDKWLAASGSAIIAAGAEVIKLGEKALVRDSELFKTLIHEELHLRLIRRARRGKHHALDLVTDPQAAVEEDYVEQVAVRYLKLYEHSYGRLKH